MKIKQKPEEFIVEEIGLNGEIYKVGKKWGWTEGKGEHLICLMEKKNWDTISAVKELAKKLNVSQKRIGYAGTKDRVAWTCQKISIWNKKKEELPEIDGIVLHPITYGERISLGDLKGNHFTITIHDFEGKITVPDKIRNYFGVQRFGEYRPVTHLVGQAIVENNFKKAVDLYLFKTFDTDKSKELRTECKDDYALALEKYPKYWTYERSMLSWLAQKPNDYVGALRTLPRKLMIMFVHAYQSYLFNKILEKRKDLETQEGDILEDNVPTGPIFGFNMPFAKGKQGELEKEILEEEWLELKDFHIQGMPDLSSEGMRRKLYIDTKDFKIISENPLTISFSLPKGCYATTVINQITR